MSLRLGLVLILVMVVVVGGCVSKSDSVGLQKKNCSVVSQNYTETIRTDPSERQLKSFNDSFVVESGFYSISRTLFEIDDKTNSIVYGNFTSSGEIDFYVFDQKNYAAWVEKQQYQPEVVKKGSSKGNFAFVPSKTDFYMFVFDSKGFKDINVNFEYEWFYNYKEGTNKTEMRERDVQICE